MVEVYKYKRGINDINVAKNMQFILSDEIDTCLSLNACMENRKIYNGLYIKKGKVLVENILDKIEIDDKVYRIGHVVTNTQKVCIEEYLTKIDLQENKFSFETPDFKYSKRICFDVSNSDTLLIEYELSNISKSKAKFSVIPFVTYRDLMAVKNSNFLRFNHRDKSNATLINISITNNLNLFLASDQMNFVPEKRFLNNVEHEFIDKDLTKKIYKEDLYLPGDFEIELKPLENKKISFYISTKEFEVSDTDNKSFFEEYESLNYEITADIADEFVELKDLAVLMRKFYLNDEIIDNVPYDTTFKELTKNIYTSEVSALKLIDIVKTIEGEYLSFNRIKDAKRELLKFKKFISEIDLEKIQTKAQMENLLKLRFWHIESINRLLQKDSIINTFFDYIKDSIYLVIRNDAIKDVLYNNVELVSLFYNALRIYQNSLIAVKKEDSTTYQVQQELVELIQKEFWIEDKRILKENLDDEVHIATISMIYALSLSYPILSNEIGIKLLDTIFKELYTPYGLREVSKFSDKNDGLIYPKYMAYFVKANLRQNGVTRASQKLAYNLVKELLLDISKYVNGGVRKIYSEKGILVDSVGIDILTNAEVVRLYNMLT